MRRTVYLTDGRDSRFSRYYEKLFNRQQECDVIFFDENASRTVKAHLPFLAEYSTFFATKCHKLSRTPIHVFMTSVNFRNIECILRAMYHRSETVDEHRIEALQSVAQILGVDIYFDPPPKSSEKVYRWPTGNDESTERSMSEVSDIEYSKNGTAGSSQCHDSDFSGTTTDSIQSKVSENKRSRSQRHVHRPVTRSMSAKKKDEETESRRREMENLQSIIAITSNADRYCFTCCKLFSTKSALKRHMQKLHADLNNEKCSMCNFLGTPKDLEKHYSDEHKLSIFLTSGGKRKRVDNHFKSGVKKRRIRVS